MFIRESDRPIIMQKTPDLERTVCMECGKVPHVLWKPARWGTILLCGECAQVVATQLMKDVRSYELDHGVAVKVRAHLTAL
jgi:transcription elongation factor Elf1